MNACVYAWFYGCTSVMGVWLYGCVCMRVCMVLWVHECDGCLCVCMDLWVHECDVCISV